MKSLPVTAKRAPPSAWRGPRSEPLQLGPQPAMCVNVKSCLEEQQEQRKKGIGSVKHKQS